MLDLIERQKAVLRQVADKQPGAEAALLLLFSELVLRRSKVTDDFRLASQLILAKAVFAGKLPSEKRGRPKHDAKALPFQVAIEYQTLIAEGLSSEEAVQELSAKFYRVDRQIHRLIALGRKRLDDVSELRKTEKEIDPTGCTRLFYGDDVHVVAPPKETLEERLEELMAPYKGVT
jgi:uncharacterized protein YoaH (UPF0181 family)